MTNPSQEQKKTRGSADISYLGRSVDQMIWEFMEHNAIPGLTLAIVQAPYVPVSYTHLDVYKRQSPMWWWAGIAFWEIPLYGKPFPFSAFCCTPKI